MDQSQPTKIFKTYNRQNSFNIPQFIQSHHHSDELMASISSNNKMNYRPIGQTIIDDDDDDDEPFTDKLNRKIPLFGLIMSMLSVVCYSLASLIVKILTEYHALEILGIRSVFQLIFYLSTTLYFRLPIFGLPGHRLDLSLRAIFGAIAAITIYMSYRLIPLADASTIQFSAPVLVFVLAYFILGEPMTCCHILIGFVALIGVVFVSKPKFILQFFDPSILEKVNYQGILLAIVAAISTAFSMIMLRKLKQTPVHIVVLWFSTVTIVSAFSTLPFISEFILPQDLRSWLWLLAIGFCGIGDQLFMTLAFKYESAGIVSVSRTMTIVLAFIWDTVILDVIVHWTSILGSILVIFSVIMLAIIRSVDDQNGIFKILWSYICCCSKRNYTDDESESEREKLLMSSPTTA
ncbi:hypothetical protein DERP_002227 [Dermatophagoides pteronyssinus]|uniref:EamA domain-containing protein n=1 Tax=Dermatophagoides pteronyssinus TaxID=6956 RepID=A0ABQ8JHJ6_DERPT|nr:hypothetical protein DERP_002227 [Dermatophagoides pteronyssinus]